MSKEKFTVSWIMEDEPLLKLKEPDETYDISEDVYKDIQKKDLHKREDEFQVEVEIDKSKGENGIITSFKVVGDINPSSKTSNSKEEPPPTDNTQTDENFIVKELTVQGVAVEKKGVIFKEEKAWYTLDDSIDAQDFKDKYTKKTVEVSIRQTDKGNDIIVAFTAQDNPVEDTSNDESQSSDPKKSNGGNMMQRSIEAQASMKSAYTIVASMVTPDSKPDFVKKLITGIAEHSYETLQNLKNKG